MFLINLARGVSCTWTREREKEREREEEVERKLSTIGLCGGHLHCIDREIGVKASTASAVRVGVVDTARSPEM